MVVVKSVSPLTLSSGHCSDGPSSSEAATVIGALLTFVAVAYSSIRTSSASQLGQLGLTVC